MFSHSGRSNLHVKIIDFGLARELGGLGRAKCGIVGTVRREYVVDVLLNRNILAFSKKYIISTAGGVHVPRGGGGQFRGGGLGPVELRRDAVHDGVGGLVSLLGGQRLQDRGPGVRWAAAHLGY